MLGYIGIGAGIAVVREIYENQREKKFQEVCAEHSRLTSSLCELLREDKVKIKLK